METNYDWYLKQDLSKFSGKWLAIVDRKVVATGKNAEQVIKEARKEYPNKRPMITKVKNYLSIL